MKKKLPLPIIALICLGSLLCCPLTTPAAPLEADTQQTEADSKQHGLPTIYVEPTVHDEDQHQLFINQHRLEHESNLEHEPTTVWLNIFVHGIMSIKPHLSIFNFLRILNDKVEETIYIKTVELMRQDRIFYENQAMQGYGLHPINVDRVVPGNASGAMACAFETLSHYVAHHYDNPGDSAHHTAPPKNLYYTFGWSGIMSYKMRYQAACQLYLAIAQEASRLAQAGFDPKIRLIGYSHGGNVLLNLAAVRQCEKNIMPLTIDELVLFGMPVQSETDHFINDPIFAKIYHFYSKGDMVQTLDFFSLKRFFSRRTFTPRRQFKLPKKLIQVEIVYMKKKSRRHRKKIEECVYDFERTTVSSLRRCNLQVASPGHSELWFFGWTPLNYRSYLPVWPFPAAAFLPLYLHETRNFEQQDPHDQTTVIEFRPEHNVLLCRNKKTKRLLEVKKFIAPDFLAELKAHVLDYKPNNYTTERYNQAIRDAYLTATQMCAQRKEEERRMRVQKTINRWQERKRRRAHRPQPKCQRKTRHNRIRTVNIRGGAPEECKW